MVSKYEISLPDTEKYFIMKHFSWLTFNSTFTFAILPFVNLFGFQNTFKYLLVFCSDVLVLGYSSYISNDDIFLGINGWLNVGIIVIIAASIGRIYYNYYNPIIFNSFLLEHYLFI